MYDRGAPGLASARRSRPGSPWRCLCHHAAPDTHTCRKQYNRSSNFSPDTSPSQLANAQACRRYCTVRYLHSTPSSAVRTWHCALGANSSLPERRLDRLAMAPQLVTPRHGHDQDQVQGNGRHVDPIQDLPLLFFDPAVETRLRPAYAHGSISNRRFIMCGLAVMLPLG